VQLAEDLQLKRSLRIAKIFAIEREAQRGWKIV
jgi:hypothetical protein